MRKKNFFSTILSLLILIALIACGYIFFKDMDGPSIAIVPDTGRVSPHTPLQITLADPSNIRSISVGVRRNNVVTPIFQRHFEEYLPQRTVEVSLKNAGLREGAFELEIKATDASLAGFGQGNTRTEVLAMRLDTQPPRISVKTLPPSVRRGGAAAIRYTIDEEVTQSGVLVAGYFVPGFLQKDGSYICFFPFPYTMTAVEYKNAVELTATDMAGNVTRSRLGLLAYERNFKSDTISISDNFLASVNSKLGYLAPNAANQLEGYLYINNQVRAANVETLRALRKDTAAAMLWDGMFQRLPRSAARAPRRRAVSRMACTMKGPPWQWISATSSPVKVRGPGMNTASTSSSGAPSWSRARPRCSTQGRKPENFTDAGLNMRERISRDCGPEMRTMPMPPAPGAVAMAAMVGIRNARDGGA